MVSRPVKAVILLFPLSDTLKAKRSEEEAKIVTEGQQDIDPSILWIKQTVRPAALPSKTCTDPA
jgi:ubiquitin carboxyl-terminal hydrolase L3